MRCRILALLVAAACGSTDSSTGGAGAGEPDPDARTRLVYRQYPRAGRRGSPILVMENLAGRELVELRSKPLEPGKHPVSYVPDDVMRKLLSEFKRFGFYKHARPRLRDPRKLGGIAELTMIDEAGRQRSLIPTRLDPGRKMTKELRGTYGAYNRCKKSFLAVWTYFPPAGQVTTSGGDFGRSR